MKFHRVSEPQVTEENISKEKHTHEQSRAMPEKDTDWKKMLECIAPKSKEWLNEKIIRFYGQNYPINYSSAYNFQEQWEDKKGTNGKTIYNYISFRNRLAMGIEIAKMLIFAVTIWFSTVEFFIKDSGKMALYQEIYSLALAVELLDITIKVAEIKCFSSAEETPSSLLFKFHMPVFCFLYLLVKLGDFEEKRQHVWVVLEITAMYFMHKRAGKIFESLRFYYFTLRYEYQAKIVDLILKIFIYTHFLALVMFLASKEDPDNNWLSNVNADHSQALQVYLYSFYFTTTTILTVGYGDLSPKNLTEVAVVIFVEIFGIMLFAYIVNEIGYSISSLRKSKEVVERDLSVVEKMREHYKMNKKLTSKLREYLVSDGSRSEHLTPEEESSINVKLNEELREQTQRQNMMAIVKSSIFFLCRWSKSMQQSAARKLQHVMFSPNNLIYQPLGKERIYVVKNGSIDIFAERNGSKRGLNNLLKTITCGLDKEVADNCYGYSSVISDKPNRMYAIARTFTSAYYLTKEMFMESISQNLTDFEYYHELKDKINLNYSCRESIEAPILESHKHHFYPTKASVLKKKFKGSRTNKRRPCDRKERSYRSTKNLYIDIRTRSSTEMEATQTQDISMEMQVQAITVTDQTYKSLVIQSDLKNVKSIVKQSQKILMLKNETANNFHNLFEQAKKYQNYFPKRNKEDVLRRYELSQLSYSKMVPKSDSSSLKKINKHPSIN